MNSKKLESIAKKTKPKEKIKTAKLRDIGRKKSKSQMSKRAQATKTQGNKRYYPELRLKAKAANERMRQLEKKGIKSPSYQSAQAMLEVLGARTKGDRGRRFSETGKATYNEMELLDKILSEFLGQKTSTLRGAKEYERDVWETAKKNYKLDEAGISRDDWLKFWASMPSKKDRIFSSESAVAMVRAYTTKADEIAGKTNLTEEELNFKDDNRLSIEDIAAEIQSGKTLKDAYNKLGLSYKEVKAAKIHIDRDKKKK